MKEEMKKWRHIGHCRTGDDRTFVHEYTKTSALCVYVSRGNFPQPAKTDVDVTTEKSATYVFKGIEVSKALFFCI